MVTKKTVSKPKDSSALYKFEAYFGRMGRLSGVFVAKPSEVAGAMGKTVRFGEVLGKHSDISLELGAIHFKRISSDPKFVNTVVKHGITCGHNPIACLADNLAEDAGD